MFSANVITLAPKLTSSPKNPLKRTLPRLAEKRTPETIRPVVRQTAIAAIQNSSGAYEMRLSRRSKAPLVPLPVMVPHVPIRQRGIPRAPRVFQIT
jgi:hypothetical protein